MGTQVKETLTFLDDDIARFMEEAAARRGRPQPPPAHQAGYYETAFRVLGRYIDEQKPRDVFFFEQERRVRRPHCCMAGQAGSRHELAEFTRDDIDAVWSPGPTLRQPAQTRARRPRGA